MPSPEELAVADAVSTELIRIVRLVEKRRAQHHPDAVERAAYHLLVHLVNGGPRRGGALAEAVHADPSTVSRQVNQLVKQGYVERVADPRDGRVTLLAATAEGRRVFAENRRHRNDAIARMLAHWTPDDRSTLVDLLGRLAGDMEGFEISAPPRRPSPDDGTP